MEETVKRIQNGSVHWIVTLNPEMLLHARRDVSYRDILRRADLRVADGAGVTLMARIFGYHLHRVTGVALAERVLEEASARGWRVAFVGGATGIAEQALTASRKRIPGLIGSAWEGGTILTDGTGNDANDETIQQLTMTAPDVLLVAFGHPTQEQWIARHLNEFPTLRLAMGIGGTFDFWAGRIPRAPAWIRGLGMEWAFRLMQEPTRVPRIVRAVLLFPLATIMERVREKKHAARS